jgi:uncharacterized membrane protein YecN with MAPEG domain
LDNLLAPALVTALTSVLLFATAINVGRMRGRHKIQPPATSGHPEFDRAYRVQMNTLESTVAFLPVLWLFAAYVSAPWAGVAGAAWLAGRVWYAIGYSIEPKKRGGGFLVSFLAFAVLTIGALAGIAGKML